MICFLIHLITSGVCSLPWETATSLEEIVALKQEWTADALCRDLPSGGMFVLSYLRLFVFVQSPPKFLTFVLSHFM